jgi:hypothetical protein
MQTWPCTTTMVCRQPSQPPVFMLRGRRASAAAAARISSATDYGALGRDSRRGSDTHGGLVVTARLVAWPRATAPAPLEAAARFPCPGPMANHLIELQHNCPINGTASSSATPYFRKISRSTDCAKASGGRSTCQPDSGALHDDQELSTHAIGSIKAGICRRHTCC